MTDHNQNSSRGGRESQASDSGHEQHQAKNKHGGTEPRSHSRHEEHPETLSDPALGGHGNAYFLRRERYMEGIPEGPHRGRGPKGYQRPDERIRENACERLTHHGGVDARDIQVSVKDGEITLEGTVENRRMKRMAEDALETIAGMKDIHNRLRVQRQDTSSNEG
jgi:osmotically-inducible protein OsmY